MAGGLFLNVAERARMQSFPDEICRDDLIVFFTLCAEDIVEVGRLRPAHNRLGFALSLGALRYLGFIPVDLSTAPPEAVEFVAHQVDADPDLTGYGDRSRTRADHGRRAHQHLGYQRATPHRLEQLEVAMVEQAAARARPSVLLADACEQLLRERIVRPGLTVLERMVLRARQVAEDRAFAALAPLVERLRQRLDAVVLPDYDLGTTPFAWLRERARTNSPQAIQDMLDKHQWLVDLGVQTWDLTGVHPNRVRHLARIGRTADSQMIQRMPAPRRGAVLVAHLRQALVDITDELMDMFGQCLTETRGRARRALQEHRRGAEATRADVVQAFVQVVGVIVDDDTRARDVRAEAFQRVPREELLRLLEECAGPARVLDPEGLDFLRTRYAYIRQFSARFLDQMDVQGDDAAAQVIDAVKVLREANETAAKTLPDDSPTSFVPARWKPFVITPDGIHRGYYELCALWELRGALRAGEAWVANSRRYAPSGSYLLSEAAWSAARATAVPLLGVPETAPAALDAKAVTLAGLGAHVRAAVDRGDLRDEDARIVIPPMGAVERPTSLVALERQVDDRLPHIELADLLVEVDGWTGLADELVHQGNGSAPTDQRRAHVYGAILSQACNVGATRMGRVADMTFEQLTWASTWHLRDETLKAATTRLVDYQYHQPISQLWGGGTLSSSDGQRFPVAGNSTSARALPRYFGFGRGVTFYTWTSDQFSQYGVKVIPATARDATYLLDELLDNETELEVLEHTTDTHGYTDLVFALFDLLGLRFAPRIRDTAGSRLYGLEGAATALPAAMTLSGTIKRQPIIDAWDEMLRVAASLKTGHVSASLLISKLQAQPQRPVVRAMIDYGRVCKTEHLLRYMSDQPYRRRIGAQLNKGEAIHALRRFLVFGNLARLTRRDTDALVNQAACLNLLTNAVVVWNTVYIARVIDELRTEGHEVDDEDIAHLSPARYEHINPFGKYVFDAPPQGTFRDLRACSNGGTGGVTQHPFDRVQGHT